MICSLVFQYLSILVKDDEELVLELATILDCQEALTWMRARKHWINGTTWQESQCHEGLPSLRLQMQFSKMQFEDSKFLRGSVSITINVHTHGVSYLACAFAIA